MNNREYVSNLVYIVGESHIKWVYQNRNLGIVTAGKIRQVFVHKGEPGYLLILTDSQSGKVDEEKIQIHDFSGMPLGDLEPPPGYSFGYIEHHCQFGTVAVCGKKIVDLSDGWLDWYFSIDMSNKKLDRRGPSY